MFAPISHDSLDEILRAAPAGMTRFRLELDDAGVLLLTIDRPERLNAFSMGYATDRPRPAGWSLFDRYLRALTQELKLDARVKVVVLTGAGRAFSAGADIKDWAAMEAQVPPGRSPFQKESLLFDEHTAMMHVWFRHLVKPTIAMVNGPAVGMGADLAAVCDLRTMADDAFFQWAYVLNGLVPTEGGMWLLPRLVGEGRALEWMLTGARVDAATALQSGLANLVAPGAQLREKTLALARHIASLPPRAVQATRFGVQAGQSMSFQDAVGLAYLSGYAVRDDTHARITARADNALGGAQQP